MERLITRALYHGLPSLIKIEVIFDLDILRHGSALLKEAAERLGVSVARLRQVVLAGQLSAQKFGLDLVINEKHLALVGDRPIGRPPNPSKKSGTKKGKR